MEKSQAKRVETSSEFTENTLFRRIVQGDSQAFSEVHTLYSARLLYYGKQLLVEWDDVEDIVADTFLALWQSRLTMRSDAHLKNFLFLTVRNKAINLVASRERREKILDSIKVEHITEPMLFDLELVEQEMMYLLDKAVQTLPPECRRIFELAWEKEQSPGEIATLLNMNPATVRSQKRRAIQLIQAWIQKNGPHGLAFLYFLHRLFFL